MMGLTRRALWVLIGGALLAFLLGLVGLGWAALIVYNLAVLGLFLADFLGAARPADLTVRREPMLQAELGRRTEVSLTLENLGTRPARLLVTDTPPLTFEAHDTGRTVLLHPKDTAGVSYAVTPRERGFFDFGEVYLVSEGPMGLVRRYFRKSCPSREAVYPDLTQMRRFRLLAERRQLDRDDSALHRLRGAGTDFQGLREYAYGDDSRKIHWKATARSGKLITKIFDVERDQNVIIAIDTGRLMMPQSQKEPSRLDHAIGAGLALAQVALSSGDRVGLVVFGGRVSGWIPPGRGQVQLKKMMRALVEVRAGYDHTDYGALMGHLATNHRKRSLICVISALESEQTAQDALETFGGGLKRHAFLFASILPGGLGEATEREVHAEADVYFKAAALYRMEGASRASSILRRAGLGSICVDPAALAGDMVGQYMRMKKLMKV